MAQKQKKALLLHKYLLDNCMKLASGNICTSPTFSGHPDFFVFVFYFPQT